MTGTWKPVLTTDPSGSLRIWDHPLQDTEYVAGIDVSEGKKRDRSNFARRGVGVYSDHRPDYSAIVVLEMESSLHVATWHGYVTPDELASVAAALGVYYNNALLVPELNGPGLAVVTRLVETLRYDNLYRSQMVNMVDIDPLLPRWGFQTNSSTRPILVMRVHEQLRDGRLWTRDEKLIGELRTMEFDDQGTARARGSNKDDLVFALALALEGRYRCLGQLQSDRPKLPPERSYEARVWEHVTKRLQAHDRSLPRSDSGRAGDFTRGRPGGAL